MKLHFTEGWLKSKLAQMDADGTEEPTVIGPMCPKDCPDCVREREEFKIAQGCCGQGCCDHENQKPEKITVEMAFEALDSLDDYARMETGIVATGAIRVLVQYIIQNHPDPLNEHTMKVYEWLIKQ